MLLQELRRLAEDPTIEAQLPIQGYGRRRVGYLISLAGDGAFLHGVHLAQGATGPAARGKEMEVPVVGRTSGTRPQLLVDGPDYVFGVDEKHPNRAQKRREAFMDLARSCAASTQSPEVAAVVAYLDRGEVPVDLGPEVDLVAFEVDERLVTDLPTVRRYWEKCLAPEGHRAECLVCGRVEPVANPWPVLIKRIPGGQPAGNQLVSANEHAFESYGLVHSETSPTCHTCAGLIGNVLNWLITTPGHSVSTRQSVFVYWTRHGSEFDLDRLFSNPDPEQVGELLRAARKGSLGALDLDPGQFFLAELGASGSRVVVRTWIDTAVAVAQANVASYFASQAIRMPDGGSPRPVSARSLAFATARDPRDVHPEILHDLLSAAIAGTSLPERVLHLAVSRCARGDRIGGSGERQMVTHARAALLKLALCPPDLALEEKERFMQQLDITSADPAYLCGRLFAVMEAIQQAALGTVNATLTDRFYGAASTAPVSVFPTLMRNMRNHLGKLRKDRPGAYRALDDRVAEVMSQLADFPNTFSLREQARFALGYYHQKGADRSAARSRKGSAEHAVAPMETEETK